MVVSLKKSCIKGNLKLFIMRCIIYYVLKDSFLIRKFLTIGYKLLWSYNCTILTHTKLILIKQTFMQKKSNKNIFNYPNNLTVIFEVVKPTETDQPPLVKHTPSC